MNQCVASSEVQSVRTCKYHCCLGSLSFSLPSSLSLLPLHPPDLPPFRSFTLFNNEEAPKQTSPTTSNSVVAPRNTTLRPEDQQLYDNAIGEENEICLILLWAVYGQHSLIGEMCVSSEYILECLYKVELAFFIDSTRLPRQSLPSKLASVPWQPCIVYLTAD